MCQHFTKKKKKKNAVYWTNLYFKKSTEAAQIPKGQFMEGSVSSMSKLLPICQYVIYQKLKSTLENIQWILRFFYEYYKEYLLFKIIFKILLSHILI